MKLMGKCFSHSELSDNGNVKDETNKKIVRRLKMGKIILNLLSVYFVPNAIASMLY